MLSLIWLALFVMHLPCTLDSCIHLLLYVVMGVIVWPYVCYHDLVQKTSAFISVHFPIVIEKAVTFWEFTKKLGELYTLMSILLFVCVCVR